MTPRLARRAAGAVAVAAVLGVACGEPEPRATPPAAAPAPALFTDVTAAAGVDWTHWNGATERRYLPETMGAGVALFDADGDDDPDLVLVGGRSVATAEGRAGAFYRNRGDGTFDEATEAAGLAGVFLGMGTAVGDVDADGDVDLFVSAVALPGAGGDRLFRNRGDGTFEDVTAASGVGGDGGFGTSAAFVDVDADGDLDLFAGRYVEWSPETDVVCRPDGVHPSYCTPEIYPPVASRLRRNRGDGTFEDATEASGVGAHRGKALGVVAVAHPGDGYPALAVANDTVRNFLFVPAGDGAIRFREVAVETGFAYSLSGATRGAMGIDAGDVDGDGLVDLVIGNFSQEMSAVYRATPAGLYRDDAAQLGVGLPTLMPLAFGTVLADLDLDGWLDLVFANGHIEPEIARFQSVQSYAQPLLVFRNRAGTFELLPPERAHPTPLVARGAATADLDGDGDLDLVVTQNGRRPVVLRNDTPPRPWLRVKLRDRHGNPTPYGTLVELHTPDGRTQRRRLVSGRSYLSASEPILTFGLGDTPTIDRLVVHWPSGTTQTVPSPAPNQLLVVEEPLD